jgi:polar amino acid transport system permease protein
MLQLFFFYFGLPFIPFIGKYLVLDRFTAGCVAFVLNYAAYFSEIFRGGLISVDKGQHEAAMVLGMSNWQINIFVIIPQMIKVVLPAVSNEAITLIKDTALVASIGITDLLHYTKSLVNSTSNVFPYFVAAAFYLIMTFVLTELFKRLEKRFMF